MKDGFHEQWKTYLGLSYCYERCAESRVKGKADEAEAKVKRATTRADQMRLD